MANTTTTLNSALVAALGELRNVPKDKVNPHFKSKFTSLDAILDATRPVLSKHGLAMSQEPVFEDGLAGVVTRIIHTSGESRESKLLLPLRDQSAQGVGSCLSYARRYAAAAVLGIASDEDDDGQIASTPSKAISKPSIPKPSAPKPETAKVLHKDDLTGQLFQKMETAGISEATIEAFLQSKGIEVPDFLVDLKIPIVKRLMERWDDVLLFSNLVK